MQQYYYKIAKSRCERVDGVSTYTDGQTYHSWQTQDKVTSPTVVVSSATNAKVQEAPRQGWMKPLLVDWTLQNVQEAHSNNAARAQLVLWMHKDRLGELTDELFDEFQIGGQTAIERLYEIREPIRYIRGVSGDFSIPITIEPISSRLKLTMKALIDSGCTGSTINQAYIKKHNLDTKKVLIPIPVYNANGTRNQRGGHHRVHRTLDDDQWTLRTNWPGGHEPWKERHLPRTRLA